MHRLTLRALAPLVLLAPALPAQFLGSLDPAYVGATATPVIIQDVIDFEGLPAGTVLDQVFSAGGLGPVLVNGSNPAFPGQNAALIFDSANPTGDDFDLGTPNETFGGPGVGVGGEVGAAYPNDTAQGNLLIVAENLVDGNGDGLVDDPDDADLTGEPISFDFTALGVVTIHGITIVDVEADEDPASVSFYDAADALIGSVDLPQVFDNGVAAVDLGAVAGVVKMVVVLNGSGAVDDVAFSIEEDEPECTGRIGDFVWLDLNGNGNQDPGEPGLSGVRLEIYDASGALIGETVTDGQGHYLFTGLCAGTYVICVDESTLPPCVVPSPCDQGESERKDSECSCATLELADDDSIWRALDFGYVPVDCAPEGCTPGYWKQSQHFDSWPAPYVPGMLFSAVFEDAFPGKTLLQVLETGGGGLDALGRHTVAALLNGAQDDVNYPLGDAAVVGMFNAVYPGTKADYTDLKDLFASNNEAGCPLN